MPGYRIRYQTVEIGDLDIHLRTLRDLNQYADESGAADRANIPPASWPLFGVVWASSQVLAHYMRGFDIDRLRILEVGCGIGLASLLLRHRQADITATDRHPEVAGFLEINARLNGLETVPFYQCDWKDQNEDMGRFDLIIGSDLVYEPGHAELLSAFINQHAQHHCEVVTVGPGRREQSRFDHCMTDLGYRHWYESPADTSYLKAPFKGRIQHYSRG